jgi:hypothetical protein
MFEEYTGPVKNPVDYIGKQESLRHDLADALNLCGEDFNEQLIRTYPVVNATPSGEVPWQLREQVYNAERSFYERHGYPI